MLKVMTFNIQHALDYQKQIIDFDLFINAIKKYGADGDYEDETVEAVNKFMKDCGFNKINGMFGKKSLAKAKALKK